MLNENITAKDLFFCYDRRVAKYLRYDKDIEFITKHIRKQELSFTCFNVLMKWQKRWQNIEIVKVIYNK